MDASPSKWARTGLTVFSSAITLLMGTVVCTPAPQQYVVPSPSSSGLSSNAIIGIAVAIVIVVFIGIFVFAKLYIRNYEKKVFARGREQDAAGENGGDDAVAADAGAAVVVGRSAADTSGADQEEMVDALPVRRPLDLVNNNDDAAIRLRQREEILNRATRKPNNTFDPADLVGVDNQAIVRQTTKGMTSEGGSPARDGRVKKEQPRPAQPHMEPSAPEPAVTVAAASREEGQSPTYSPMASDDDDDVPHSEIAAQQRAAYLTDLGFAPEEQRGFQDDGGAWARPTRPTPQEQQPGLVVNPVIIKAAVSTSSASARAVEAPSLPTNVALPTPQDQQDDQATAFVAGDAATADDLHFEFDTTS
jgi:hypothetical protein